MNLKLSSDLIWMQSPLNSFAFAVGYCLKYFASAKEFPPGPS
jgi:hypothetical protein